MRTKKWRPIIIKDPRLRRMRKNLRTILDLAIHDELERLSHLEELYTDKSKLTPSQKQRKILLSRQGNDLIHAYNNSILYCSGGVSAYTQKEREQHSKNNMRDLDMVWNPAVKRWHCINCYEIKYGTEEKRKDIELFMKRDRRYNERFYKKWQEEHPPRPGDYVETFCLVGKFTKFTRNKAEKLIQKARCRVQSEVDRKLDYLVVAKSESLPYYKNLLKNRRTEIIPEADFLEYMRDEFTVW